MLHPDDIWSNPQPPYCPDFIAAHPQFADLHNHLKTPEEKLAASWCMDYYAPLSLPKPHLWQLVTYEKLVQEGETELQRIFGTWDMEIPPEAIARLQIPSATTAEASNVYQGKDPLSGWKEHLTPVQIKRILSLVELFGLDFYSEDLEPDYERLYVDPEGS